MLPPKARNAARTLVLSLALTPLVALMLGSNPSAAQTAAPVPTTETSPEPVVNSALTAEMFFVLLLAEVNLQAGQAGAGHSLMLEAARKSGEPLLYQRAVQSSLSADAALNAARAWRGAQPANRDANRTLLQLLIAMNRLGDSVEPLKTELLLATPQDLPLAIATVPRYYAQVADKKTATAVVEQALSSYLNDSVSSISGAAWGAVGRMKLLANDSSAAFQAAQRATAQDPASTGAALLSLELMNRKVAGAEALVKRHMAGKPSPEVRMAYARMLLNGRRYGEALKQLQTLSAEKPDFAEAWLVTGVLQLQEGQPAPAASVLNKYVELATAAATPSDGVEPEEKKRGLIQAYLSLAQIAEDKKDWPAAQSWLDKIDDPKSALSVATRRASLLARQGSLNEARKLLQNLPQEDDGQARQKLLAEVSLLREHKKNQDAYDLLTRSQNQFADDPDLHYEQAMLAEKLGQLTEMEHLLQKVMRIKPDYHHAYNALGFSLADRNVRLPEAKQLIKKALEVAPDDPFIQDSLGWVEFRIGNKPEALKILEAAYQSKPDVEIAAHLGEVLWSLGLQAKAMAIWREGYKLSPANETLQATLKRLRIRL